MYGELHELSVLPGGAIRKRVIAGKPACLGALGAAALSLLAVPAVRNDMASGDGSLIMTGVAVAIGAAGAVLVKITGRLARQRQALWLSAGLALYSVAIVPFSASRMVSEQTGMTLSTARLVTYWMVIALLAVAARPPQFVVGSVSGGLARAGLLVALATTGLASLVYGAMASTVTQAALVTTVCCLVTALAADGRRQRDGPLLRGVGLGLLVIAAAHLYRIAAGVPISEPSLAFSVPRLIGLSLVLLASVQLTQQAWHARCVQDSDRQAELRVRAAHLERVAHERDHELRNGLASLAGLHLLIGRSLDADDAERLRPAVASELRRLEAILENRCLDAPPEGYLVAPVLTDLVTLRRSAGRDVELDVDARLRATGSPEALAQVVTNLLANCERHAPGSRVSIRASGDEDRVLVEVADSGPGIPPELRPAVLERGIRGGRTAGSGLGLHICRQLIEAQGGVLHVLDPRPPQTGCTVLVELRPAPRSPTIGSAASPMISLD